MKKVEAVIQPHRLQAVLAGLEDIVYASLTIAEVRTHGAHQVAKQWLGRTYYEDPLMARLEIIIDDDVTERAISIIQDRAATGRPGDAQIFVYRVEDVINVSL